MTALALDQAVVSGSIQVAADAVCAHCGQPAPTGARFCCPGCTAAFDTIQTLGLGRYYQQRLLDPASRPPRPDSADSWDLSRYIEARPDGRCELSLAIDGLQCGACVWLIESVLARVPKLETGRVNMTTRRLKLVWRGGMADAAGIVARVEALGYRLVPFDAHALAAAQDQTGRALLRALAVAGFAAGNVMLISIGIWAGEAAGWLDGMGPATRDLLHFVSALIALPAIAYAGRPFFVSALAALRHCRTNMDVPISLGVLLVSGMSLAASFAHGQHTYFDSALTLLFFLLIGRVLDHRARGQARATAEQLLTLRATDVAVLQPDGAVMRRPPHTVAAGDRVLVGPGERVGVDGVVESGESALDASLVTGESVPVPARAGTPVFAGTLNLGQALTIRATAAGGDTLLAECVRLIEAAEARRSRFVVLADRVARRYAPAVHAMALLTFLGWWIGAGASLSQSLLTASAVLIITCPCALALAVPAVQVIATSRLFRHGVLLKSATALERLAEVDTVVFDKTGTLSEPTLGLVAKAVDPAVLRQAASLAVVSRHPLARALAAAAGPVAPAVGAVEHPGEGIEAGDVRLGSARFCGVMEGCGDIGVSPSSWPGLSRPPVAALSSPGPIAGTGAGHDMGDLSKAGDDIGADEAPELWLSCPGQPPVCFRFRERLRDDATTTVAALRRSGLAVRLISGDQPAAVARVAEAVGIADWRAGCSPVGKIAAIEALAAAGHRVLMVGDGLNDSPSLAAAHVSASPSTGADISQTVADVVFQGAHLAPVADVLSAARRARALMRENFALSLGYNLVMVPLAVAGFVTPWLAAAAMSSSSLLVMANSFRARRGGRA